MSPYAQEFLEEFFRHLQQYDVVTISGMAQGVDDVVHKLSMQYGIPTIAILGQGLGHVMRSGKASMVQKIVDAGGLVFSEFPLKMKSSPWSFPQRNRIIAGLAQCVVLPEAGEKSGSLITVDFAHAMQVPVYGVPGHFQSVTSA